MIMKKPLKILLGGVPFGRNNVGDEAILECIVKIVRSVCPEAQITVSTDNGPATAAKLGVNTVQLFGFEPPFSLSLMQQTLQTHDVFIWSGATGLSDYPEIPVKMLRIAQQAGKKTIVWGVGMNDELNPFFYTLLPGLKQKVLRAATHCLFHKLDFVRYAENLKVSRTKKRIAQVLSLADMVVLRDPESRNEVLRCGDIANVTVGADSALLLEPADLETAALADEVRAVLASRYKKIGFCISAQRKITATDELVDCFNQLVEDNSARIVFVPMNPLTDSVLMAGLRSQMKHPDRAVVIEGQYEPSEILAIASQLDVIASSRLHLLILASIVHVPIIGISRGSKVDNFLKPFGLTTAGGVESCDFERLIGEINRLLTGRKDFENSSRKVRRDLLQRLDIACCRLKKALSIEE
ncbi:MAG: polysaccharide pyruvyl transferase family protein [Kiritimatiellales bacterium]